MRLPDWLVQNPNFVLLWLAYGVAAVGDHLSEMALLQERGGLERPDVTRIQALMSFGFFLPFVLLGPIAGWWSDRFSRKVTMILADVLRGMIVFNLAYIVVQLERWLEPDRLPGVGLFLAPLGTLPGAVSPPTGGWGDLAIVLPLALVGALAAFFSPARQAMLPTLIREDQLVRANAMINALGTIGGITGGVVGGVLVKHLGPQGLHHNYHLNAMTFAISAILVSCIVMSRTRAVPHPRLEGMLVPIANGFRYVRKHRRILQLILLGTVFWGAAGVVISVVPAVVRDVFGGDIQQVAIYRGLIVVGLAAGAAVMSIVGPSMPMQLAVLGGLLGGGFWVLAVDVAYVVFAGTPARSNGEFGWPALLTGVCLFGVGGAGAALLVTIMATIQRFVPDSRRGRVFGVSDMSTMGAMVLTSGLLGLAPIPNLDAYIPGLLGATGLGLLAALVVGWRIYRRGAAERPLVQLTLWLINFYGRFWCGVRRVGPCTLPVEGPAIVAANHSTGIDPIMILTCSPRRTISFLVERKFYGNPVLRFFMKMVHCIPVSRDRPEKSALGECLRALDQGRVLGIFPHGRFAVPGEPPPPLKPGIGAIALKTGVPVIPVHISGTRFSPAVLGAFLLRHKVRVRFGRPVDLSDLRQGRRTREQDLEAAERIMAAVHALAPPDASAGEAGD